MDRSVIDAAICACEEHTGWSEDEVRNVLCAVVAESPDALLEALPEVIAWAKRVEEDAALIAIAKRMPRGVLELRWMDNRVGARIRPSCNVRKVPEGFEILLPGEGASDGHE